MAVSRSCWIFAISAGVLAIGLLTFLGVYEKPEKSPVNVNGYYNEYTKFAVVSDDSRCSQIGSDILEKGGSAVDAGIATAVCIGVVNPQASGIGGSMFMTYKNHESGDNFALNARETAPLGSDQNMFESYDESTYGGRSIAIPGQIKGFHASWEKYGNKNNVTWKDLFQPSIDLARKGYKITNALYEAIEDKYEQFLKNPVNNLGIFMDNSGRMLKIGETVRDYQLANALEAISEDAESFYSGGLMRDMVKDIEEAGGIINEKDFSDYSVILDENVQEIGLDFFGVDLVIPPAPSSGALLAYIMGTYDLYNSTTSNPGTLEYQRITEIFKFAYGQRSNIADPVTNPEVEATLEQLVNKKFWQETKSKISDVSTSQESAFYGGNYTITEDHGTSHISVMTDTESVALTCTVNLFFGSKIKGKRSGVIFNDSMDDFSSPGIVNDFGVQPSPANFIKPGKRPQSSMTPTIISKKEGGGKLMTVGGAGGTKITTASALVALNKLAFGKSLKNCVADPRIHHQLDPMILQYQEEFDEGVVEELASLGHVVSEYSYGSSSSPAIFFDESNGKIQAKGDNRREDCEPAGL